MRTWVMLVYRLPREPSTPRIAIWRRLKRLGVAQLGDGLVALPADSRTREALEWVAESVLEAGGQASVWLSRPSTSADEALVVRAMTEARAREYASLVEAADRTADGTEHRTRDLSRLRSQYREIVRRDFFPPAERDRAEAALARLEASDVEGRPRAKGRRRR